MSDIKILNEVKNRQDRGYNDNKESNRGREREGEK